KTLKKWPLPAKKSLPTSPMDQKDLTDAVNHPTSIELITLAGAQVYLIIDRLLRSHKARKNPHLGRATKSQITEMITKFEAMSKRMDLASSKFDSLVIERRRDMDFLLSAVSSGKEGTYPAHRLLLIEDNPNDRQILKSKLSGKFKIDEAE